MFTNHTFEKITKTKKMRSYKERERHSDGMEKSINTRERQKARKKKQEFYDFMLGE